MKIEITRKPEAKNDNPKTSHPARSSGPARLRSLQRDQKFDPKWLHLWASSPERDWYRESKRDSVVRGAAGLALLLTAGFLGLTWPVPQDMLWIAPVIALLGVVALAWAALPYCAARRAFTIRKKELAEYRVNIALKELIEAIEDGTGTCLPLPRIFELNRRQLDEYQSLTKRQQRVAFQLTWIAATVAFVVLLAGIILTLTLASTAPPSAQYLVGGLTGLGAVLSGYLGKTFFQGHRAAMAQLNYYYAEPFLTGRVLAAERIARNMGDNAHAKYADQLVTSLLEWTPPEPPPPGDKRRGKSDASSSKSDQQSSNGRSQPSGSANGAGDESK